MTEADAIKMYKKINQRIEVLEQKLFASTNQDNRNELIAELGFLEQEYCEKY